MSAKKKKPAAQKKPQLCPCIAFEHDDESDFPEGCYSCGHAAEEHRDSFRECTVPIVTGGSR